jgi:phospholipid/cholesterol/gamma-HCH transport system ATP-binding protein
MTTSPAGPGLISDRVAVLYRGSIIAAGSPQEIQASEHPMVRQFISGSLEGPIQMT